MKMFSGLTSGLSAFRHRNYRIYATGNSLSLIGMWMQRIATGWLAWELTGSGAWLGAIAFADLFPTVIIGPFAGALADRLNRLRLTQISQALAMCQATALFVFMVSGLMSIWLLLVMTLLQGMIIAFNQPARFALISALVPREDLANIVAINSIIFNLARFIGPAMAGIIIVSVGVAAAFAINAASYLVFLYALSRLELGPDVEPKRERGKFSTDLIEGLKYTVTHKGIAAILILLIAAGIGGRPIVELLPGFSDKVFSSGADGLAILTSSIGVGAIIAGLWLSGRSGSMSLIHVALGSSLMLAITTIWFALTQSLWAAVPALVAGGFAMAASGIAAQTLIQLSVDGAMRGRVLSLFGLIFRGAPAVGALAMGFASDYVGLSLPVIFGAVIIIAAWGWTWLRYDRISEALRGGG